MIGATNEVARAVVSGFVCGGADADMKVPALIMAGGKGKRMGLPTEKPLLPFLGKPLIDWVVEAVWMQRKFPSFTL